MPFARTLVGLSPCRCHLYVASAVRSDEVGGIASRDTCMWSLVRSHDEGSVYEFATDGAAARCQTSSVLAVRRPAGGCGRQASSQSLKVAFIGMHYCLVPEAPVGDLVDHGLDFDASFGGSDIRPVC